MSDLFGAVEENAADDVNRPLADRMRPKVFGEVLGQDHLLAKGTLFANALASDGVFPSIIFWGTPGCGKTTMARLIADHTDAKFVMISAITSATAELRKIFERAQADKSQGRRTLLLVDEILVQEPLVRWFGSEAQDPADCLKEFSHAFITGDVWPCFQVAENLREVILC